MCVVSSIMDNWNQRYPLYYPAITAVSREEFEALKYEVEELKNLLKVAKEFDEKTGQPDCELEEKFELLKRVAEAVGVDLRDVIKNE